MLEGQVAILSSGLLTADEAVDLAVPCPVTRQLPNSRSGTRSTVGCCQKYAGTSIKLYAAPGLRTLYSWLREATKQSIDDSQ